MKIQCDVCNKHEASFFCTADEAALCDGCDHRVHYANKLASKHERFSLSHPSAKHNPVCDVCHEKRAFVFCQQDRAILCKECDFPIHSSNEHTKKHNRFLLSGIKLSDSTTLHSSSPHNSMDNSKASSSSTNEEAGFTSSISEYLINTIPGWQFEDFLDSSSPSVPFDFSKNGYDDDMLPLPGGAGNERNMGGIWVPQAPSYVYSAQMDQQNIGYRETKETTNNIKGSRSRLRDDTFIVPQISNLKVASNKRSRLLW
ncbi:B-box zinc finger protein 21-like [Gastrolobium bilobum]|uniref:B-box zinc finger protein 21-like n=1 Tax=Gastrolobium bilobum TaxID=150636 RepID=UPI002AB277B5|nr:B-box zinc finger protein 21-like [Gastrolobium bilobum]